MKNFIIGLMLGFLMTAVGSMIVLEYKLKKSKLLKTILNERDHYKEFYDEYWDERNGGY